MKQLEHLGVQASRTIIFFTDCEVATFKLMKDLESYVLAGDSYGAVSSIAVAARQLKGLKGLVLSGDYTALLKKIDVPTLILTRSRCARRD
ncbi:hypothetical protein ACREYJ_12550 [Pseudomonas kribbensis]|uniref:hypothetical protein n=1 Tax=Pseudomonas kribbensis TaxID=1628086 RepID=UPI003D77DEAF